MALILHDNNGTRGCCMLFNQYMRAYRLYCDTGDKSAYNRMRTLSNTREKRRYKYFAHECWKSINI